MVIPGSNCIAMFLGAAIAEIIRRKNREAADRFVVPVSSGLIAGETETALTLKSPDGTEQSFARSEIAVLKATGSSPMPEGLEGVVNPQQMADLIAFLRDAP